MTETSKAPALQKIEALLRFVADKNVLYEHLAALTS